MPALGLSCAVLFILQFENWPASFALEMEIQTERYARLELLYDQGNGFGRQNAVRRLLSGGAQFKSLAFPISIPRIHNLNLFQSQGSDSLKIRSIQVRMPGRPLLAIPSVQIRSARPGTIVSQIDDAIEVKGTNGNATVVIALPNMLEESRTSRRLRTVVLVALLLNIAALGWVVLKQPPAAISPALEERRKSRMKKAVLISLACLYLLASLARLNGSATALWRIYADRRAPDAGLLLGTPKDIRSDEWVGQTPWILSQAARGFTLQNPGVGNGAMPLLNNLPARHWTMLFRPQMWAFFFCDLEHAFAFYWNYKWFSLVLGAFLCLHALCRGNSLVALFGALLLLFSPFVQWWFSTPTSMPEMIGAFFLIMWSTMVIARDHSRSRVVFAAIVLTGSVLQFIFCAYPRFQVPLIYLALFLLLAALIERRQWLASAGAFRVWTLATAAVLIVLLTLAWYHDVAGAIHRISALIYPGKSFSIGGDFAWQQLFMPFLEFSMTDQHYPADQMNVCEAAGFLFLAPLLAVACMTDAIRRRCDPVMIGSLLFIAVAIWFMLLGFSDAVARWSGFSLVYPARVVLAISIASIVGLSRYLSGWSSKTVSPAVRIAISAGLVLLLFLILQNTNQRLAGFVNASAVIAASFFFALVFALLWYRQILVAAILILVPTIYSTGLANPIGQGLPGFTSSGTFHWLAQKRSEQPDAKWLVIGRPSARTNFLPQFVKAAGATTLGGYRCEPDDEMVRALDPAGKYSAVYNRYAEILFLVSSSDEPSFQLTFINHYNVLLPLKPAILNRLGVNYILEADLPAAEGRIDGYSIAGEHEGLRLLQLETRP